MCVGERMCALPMGVKILSLRITASTNSSTQGYGDAGIRGVAGVFQWLTKLLELRSSCVMRVIFDHTCNSVPDDIRFIESDRVC